MGSVVSKLGIVLAVALTSASILPKDAVADVLLSQPGPQNGPGLLSSKGWAVGFDDFKLPQADTITGVQWEGSGVSAGTTFTIGFTTDSSPGSFYPNITPFVTETVTPTSASYSTYFDQFTATLPTSVALAASTDYWISIYDPNGFWEWLSATAAPDPGALPAGISAGYINGNVNLNGMDLSFALIGNPTPQSVPEPGSLAMLGMAIMGLALLNRRKQRSR